MITISAKFVFFVLVMNFFIIHKLYGDTKKYIAKRIMLGIIDRSVERGKMTLLKKDGRSHIQVHDTDLEYILNFKPQE